MALNVSMIENTEDLRNVLDVIKAYNYVGGVENLPEIKKFLKEQKGNKTNWTDGKIKEVLEKAKKIEGNGKVPKDSAVFSIFNEYKEANKKAIEKETKDPVKKNARESVKDYRKFRNRKRFFNFMRFASTIAFGGLGYGLLSSIITGAAAFIGLAASPFVVIGAGVVAAAIGLSVGHFVLANKFKQVAERYKDKAEDAREKVKEGKESQKELEKLKTRQKELEKMQNKYNFPAAESTGGEPTRPTTPMPEADRLRLIDTRRRELLGALENAYNRGTLLNLRGIEKDYKNNEGVRARYDEIHNRIASATNLSDDTVYESLKRDVVNFEVFDIHDRAMDFEKRVDNVLEVIDSTGKAKLKKLHGETKKQAKQIIDRKREAVKRVTTDAELNVALNGFKETLDLLELLGGRGSMSDIDLANAKNYLKIIINSTYSAFNKDNYLLPEMTAIRDNRLSEINGLTTKEEVKRFYDEQIAKGGFVNDLTVELDKFKQEVEEAKRLDNINYNAALASVTDETTKARIQAKFYERQAQFDKVRSRAKLEILKNYDYKTDGPVRTFNLQNAKDDLTSRMEAILNNEKEYRGLSSVQNLENDMRGRINAITDEAGYNTLLNEINGSFKTNVQNEINIFKQKAIDEENNINSFAKSLITSLPDDVNKSKNKGNILARANEIIGKIKLAKTEDKLNEAVKGAEKYIRDAIISAPENDGFNVEKAKEELLNMVNEAVAGFKELDKIAPLLVKINSDISEINTEREYISIKKEVEKFSSDAKKIIGEYKDEQIKQVEESANRVIDSIDDTKYNKGLSAAFINFERGRMVAEIKNAKSKDEVEGIIKDCENKFKNLIQERGSTGPGFDADGKKAQLRLKIQNAIGQYQGLKDVKRISAELEKIIGTVTDQESYEKALEAVNDGVENINSAIGTFKEQVKDAEKEVNDYAKEVKEKIAKDDDTSRARLEYTRADIAARINGAKSEDELADAQNEYKEKLDASISNETTDTFDPEIAKKRLTLSIENSVGDYGLLQGVKALEEGEGKALKEEIGKITTIEDYNNVLPKVNEYTSKIRSEIVKFTNLQQEKEKEIRELKDKIIKENIKDDANKAQNIDNVDTKADLIISNINGAKSEEGLKKAIAGAEEELKSAIIDSAENEGFDISLRKLELNNAVNIAISGYEGLGTIGDIEGIRKEIESINNEDDYKRVLPLVEAFAEKAMEAKQNFQKDIEDAVSEVDSTATTIINGLSGAEDNANSRTNILVIENGLVSRIRDVRTIEDLKKEKEGYEDKLKAGITSQPTNDGSDFEKNTDLLKFLVYNIVGDYKDLKTLQSDLKTVLSKIDAIKDKESYKETYNYITGTFRSNVNNKIAEFQKSIEADKNEVTNYAANVKIEKNEFEAANKARVGIARNQIIARISAAKSEDALNAIMNDYKAIIDAQIQDGATSKFDPEPLKRELNNAVSIVISGYEELETIGNVKSIRDAINNITTQKDYETVSKFVDMFVSDATKAKQNFIKNIKNNIQEVENAASSIISGLTDAQKNGGSVTNILVEKSKIISELQSARTDAKRQEIMKTYEKNLKDVIVNGPENTPFDAEARQAQLRELAKEKYDAKYASLELVVDEFGKINSEILKVDSEEKYKEVESMINGSYATRVGEIVSGFEANKKEAQERLNKDIDNYYNSLDDKYKNDETRKAISIVRDKFIGKIEGRYKNEDLIHATDGLDSDLKNATIEAGVENEFNLDEEKKKLMSLMNEIVDGEYKGLETLAPLVGDATKNIKGLTNKKECDDFRTYLEGDFKAGVQKSINEFNNVYKRDAKTEIVTTMHKPIFDLMKNKDAKKNIKASLINQIIGKSKDEYEKINFNDCKTQADVDKKKAEYIKNIRDKAKAYIKEVVELEKRNGIKNLIKTTGKGFLFTDDEMAYALGIADDCVAKMNELLAKMPADDASDVEFFKFFAEFCEATNPAFELYNALNVSDESSKGAKLAIGQGKYLYSKPVILKEKTVRFKTNIGGADTILKTGEEPQGTFYRKITGRSHADVVRLGSDKVPIMEGTLVTDDNQINP